MKTRKFMVFVILTIFLSLQASSVLAWRSGEVSQKSHVESAKPIGIDLDVTYISRLPLYNRYSVLYTWDGRPYLQPGTESDKRWPSPGEVVTFTAHFINKGTTASGVFAFKWLIDGIQVASGSHSSLAPNQEGTESYQWVWGHTLSGERLLGSHTVSFVADPANLISETYEANNILEDRTDAMSLVMILSPSAYAAYETPVDPQWSYSAEDWLQKQIAAMNAAFQRSVYPSTANGILERVRVDKILVTDTPPQFDATEDGLWYIDNDVRNVGGYYDPITDVDGGLIHELTHQLGIIDMYNLNVGLETPQVLDRFGQPVQMEYSTSYLFPGIMNDPGIQPPIYDEHTALALNANKGYRRGYYGEYLYDVSNQVYLRVLDNQGSPAVGVTVKLYQRSSDPGEYGGWFGTIDNVPEITGVTDGNGIVLLTNRSVGSPVTTNTGHVLHDNPLGLINVVGINDEFILELTKGDHQEFSWLDITTLNLARWRDGGNSSATIDLPSRIPSSDAPAAPLNLAGMQESGLVKLHWSASPSSDVAGYNIYRTNNSASQYQRIATGITTLSYSAPYDFSLSASTYFVTALDQQGGESGFSNPFYAFRLINPTGIVINDQNDRMVLDPQNGYALLYQLGNGTFFDTRGSVDYHLEFSRYIARDSNGHLILSHPADYYSTRHSVRILDQNIEPVLEFGTQGSGAGQFQTPTGVAAWGQPCSIGGPYSVDEHTLLLLHFDNSYDGAQGEAGIPNGTAFTAGKYAQGVIIDSNDTLTYATSGNLNRSQGAIEFWIRPHWNGDDNQSYTFFESGNAWFNRMRIMKDGANNLRFMLWDSDTEYGVADNVAEWQAGEWHHVATTWTGTNIALYVDGELRANNNAANSPDTLADTLYIGSSLWLDQQAEADFDEFRISDIARIGSSGSCNERILVADSGNNRIQAFDTNGNFITTYGTFGNGPGQFNDPQGLAVDGNGNVIVVDSGNNRLQVLSFNGSNFGFVRNITAGFNQPMGVSTYGSDRILVADTGNNKIKVLNAQGALLAEYMAPNDGNLGAFNQPHGVVGDRSARIVVADTGNNRIVLILGALPGINNPPTDILISKSDIDEDQAVGTLVGDLSTLDLDVGDTFTYAFCGGADDDAFTITGDSLKSAVVFDYETKTSYSVCIRTTDSGSLSATKTFVISINDKMEIATFADVPSSYWAWQYIERLYNNNITGGCSTNPLKYCPESEVTRAQMAVFLLKGVYGSDYVPPDATGTIFLDIPADHMFGKWIEQLSVEGITGGCGNGIYCPDSPVTREQMAIFLLRAKHGNTYTPPAASGVFADVPADYWAASWIEQLAAEGITGGCGGGKYCPKGTVTRAQMAVFLVAAFNLP